MKKGLALAAGGVIVAGAVPLALATGSPADSAGGDRARPVPPATAFERRGFGAAGREALGRRVLVLDADPGKTRVARIFESGRAATGWALFPAAPPSSPSFLPVLDALAAAAGAAWDGERGFPPEILRAFEVFAVKSVLVDDAGKGATPLTALVRAEPVIRLDAPAELSSALSADPVAFAAALRTTPAKESEGWTWSDWDDSLWGGAVTVETSRAAQFVFPYPAEGARATVDGNPGAASSAGPLLVLDLPAGRSRVEVSFVEAGAARWLAIGGGLGVVAGLVTLLLAFRPSRAEVESGGGATGGRESGGGAPKTQ